MIPIRRSSIVLPFSYMSTYLVFSVDQKLRADKGRGVGHMIIGFALDCYRRDETALNTQPTLNLPLCTLGVSVSDFRTGISF